ncbi:MAG: hypothetical protein AB4050_10465 [Synechococcus sp.]
MQSFAHRSALLGVVSAFTCTIAPSSIYVETAAAQEIVSQPTAQSDEVSLPIDRILDTAEPISEDSDTFKPTLSELDFNRLPHPYESVPPRLEVDLSQLVLLPSPNTVTWLDKQFETEVASINSRIAFRQELLQQLLQDPDSSDDRIRQVQSILSQLRAERDRIAIEHLLLVRQVSENGSLPTQATSSGLE